MALTQIKGEGLVSTYAIGSEGGAVTTSIQQGVAKAWTRFDPSTNTEYDSLNQSSRTDNGTGLCTVNFTNNFNNAYHAGTMDCASGTTPTSAYGANIDNVYGQTTSVTQLAYGYSGNGAGTTWALFDYTNQKAVIHGDLA